MAASASSGGVAAFGGVQARVRDAKRRACRSTTVPREERGQRRSWRRLRGRLDPLGPTLPEHACVSRRRRDTRPGMATKTRAAMPLPKDVRDWRHLEQLVTTLIAKLDPTSAVRWRARLPPKRRT